MRWRRHPVEENKRSTPIQHAKLAKARQIWPDLVGCLYVLGPGLPSQSWKVEGSAVHVSRSALHWTFGGSARWTRGIGIATTSGRRSTASDLGACTRISNRIGPPRYSSLRGRASFRSSGHGSVSCDIGKSDDDCTSAGPRKPDASKWYDAKRTADSHRARKVDWRSGAATAHRATYRRGPAQKVARAAR